MNQSLFFSSLQTFPPLILALLATLSFSYASTIFTEFSRSISPQVMNLTKAIIAFSLFLLSSFFLQKSFLMTPKIFLFLLTSGLLGLMIGDTFMLKAMKELGAAPMLMIFGLQPFFLGVAGHFLFHQSFRPNLIVGMLFMVACIYTLGFIKLKNAPSIHGGKGILFGLLATLLDGVGLILSRYSFDQTPGLSSIEANTLRSFGALGGFFVYHWFIKKIPIYSTLKALPLRKKGKILLGSILGTYISLILYLTAISKGQLSVVTSITLTGPLFAGILECLMARRWPHWTLYLSFVFFVLGFLAFNYY